MRHPDRKAPDAAAERAGLLQLVSLLLQYPDPELLAARPQLAAAARTLPRKAAREALTAFTHWYTAAAPVELAAQYVETFDLHRRCTLYLTYYLHGDTRRRGMALLELKRRYRSAGLTPPDGELPDFLPMVCEYAALAGPEAGEAPLRQHRKGLEVLRAALEERGSPYALVLGTLCGLLPAMSEAELDQVAGLALAGPPAELVGLAAGLPGYPAATGDAGSAAGSGVRR